MKYTIFGESHGPAIGVVIDDVPSGLEINMELVRKEMDRRKPGKDALSTQRKEDDLVEIISGVFEGKTTGTPLTAIIHNNDQHSKDYSKLKNLPRPGHADYAGYVRYDGCNDYRGGGHFSGRLTAPLVFAGAIAKQILQSTGVFVGAHISSIYGINDAYLDKASDLFGVSEKEFPVIDDAAGEEMKKAIMEAKSEEDSVGGSIECVLDGMPAGLGSPDFGKNVEGIISQYMFAVPAVKAIAFGAGTAFSLMRGSEANDPIIKIGDCIATKTNNAGGVNGGITNGMPIVFEVTMRPTPSISLPQETVNLETGEEEELEITGRHDPCIVHRAVPVIEAAAALAACDILGI